MNVPHVDLVVLSRDDGPLDRRVRRGVLAQRGITFEIHRVVGTLRAGDPHRWEAICRARNRGRMLGASRRVMFLDDDVVLGPDCVRRLAEALDAQPQNGALAADYLGERLAAGARRHVAMGATLFRRSALARIRFRWEPGRCECQCCCDDLRAMGLVIDYLPAAQARHLKAKGIDSSVEPSSGTPSATSGRAAPHVLVAFDRRHLEKFRRQFLRSLRGHGNRETVTVVGYGLYPSEQAVLRSVAGVRVVPVPVNGVMPPVRRLRDFQTVVASLAPDTPVAYWDAGDVVFQARLDRLWETVRANPDKLLAVREPKSHPQNAAVAAWTLSIRDPQMRRRAFDLISRRPFLNSGFAAGTARTMLRYLREANRMTWSRDLAGTSDWGDQTAFNLYCHADPNRWLEVEEGWNYCLHDRRPGEVRVRSDGRVVSMQGSPVYVVHGNARSLRKLALSGAV